VREFLGTAWWVTGPRERHRIKRVEIYIFGRVFKLLAEEDEAVLLKEEMRKGGIAFIQRLAVGELYAPSSSLLTFCFPPPASTSPTAPSHRSSDMQNARTPVDNRSMPNQRQRVRSPSDSAARIAAADEKRQRRMAKRARRAEMMTQAKVIWPALDVIEKKMAEVDAYLDGVA
jgi:hypothetical protein